MNLRTIAYLHPSIVIPMVGELCRECEGSRSGMGALYRKVGFKSANGSYMQAVNGGGGAVTFNPGYQSTWETFVLVNRSGDTLNSGDKIQLVTSDLTHYVTAEGGGGRELVANRSNGSIWETFGIFKIAGPGPILNGDKVALQTYNGKYVQAINGGGGAAAAGADNISTWETFTISIEDAPMAQASQPEPAQTSQAQTIQTTSTPAAAQTSTDTTQTASVLDSITDTISSLFSTPAAPSSQTGLATSSPALGPTSFFSRKFSLFGFQIPYLVPIAIGVFVILGKKKR